MNVRLRPARQARRKRKIPRQKATLQQHTKLGELGQKTRFFSITTEYAKPSAGKSALVQKLLFLGGRGAAQDSISMRETPKASNNIAVDFRPTQGFGVQRRHQAYTLFLGRQIFGMFERHVIELPQIFRPLPVSPAAIACSQICRASPSVANIWPVPR